jgi:hypothetical protein
MKRVVLTLALLAAACYAADLRPPDGASEEKRRDIIRLIELTKAADTGELIIRQLRSELSQSLASEPEELRERIIKIHLEEFGAEFSRAKMTEALVPLYDMHMSAEDVKALIKFYESPLGRRTVDAAQAIMLESNEDTTKRGREAFERAMKRVNSERLFPPPPPPPPMRAPEPEAKPPASGGRGRG